ncbi:MAG: thioredoxin family protein [Candidatus Hodarchaeota archaeon]
MVTELTDGTIDAFIKEHELVILDIYTVWCGPCVMQAKILEDLAPQLDSKRAVIAKIDADQAPKTSEQFGIRAIPTLILFKNGEPVNTHVGVWPMDDMLKTIKELLK